MHEAVKSMLEKYDCQSERDYINALKEIFQEIALLGLWRSKFYEKAAFYGGSALRILHGLDRFSEDLDFTLLEPMKNFDLAPYNRAIVEELASFGFQVSVDTKIKNIQTHIESAFIKAESRKQLIVIEAPSLILNHVHSMHTIKIKMEVDTNPPQGFNTEVKAMLRPIPFSIKTLTLSDLFSGKVHALLCRPWKKRIKGRDWYDFVWYVSREVPVNLLHLKERLVQSKAWKKESPLTQKDLSELLIQKIENTDFENAKKDVSEFLNDPDTINLWGKEFFLDIVSRMACVYSGGH